MSDVERKIERKRVVGSGGRPRTVTVCEFGCWHNSYGQAVKCSNAKALLASLAERNARGAS